MPRNYEDIAISIPVDAPRLTRMRAYVDALWDRFNDRGVSWIGFYERSNVNADQLILATCRDKPACSPIEMYGACGKVYRTGVPLIVHDVLELGENYIACDPRDRSEVVVPCFDNGACWGVLDLDSYDVGAFDDSDVKGLTALLVIAALTDAAQR